MKSPGRVVILIAAATTVLAACQKAAAPFGPQDEAAVRAVFDSVVADVRGGHWEEWSKRFTEDARFYPNNSPIVAGRAAILAWGKSFPSFESFSFTEVTVAGEGNLAYGGSRVTLKLVGIPADTAKQLVVFRRAEGGRWMLQAVAVSTDLPLPPPPAAPGKKK